MKIYNERNFPAKNTQEPPKTLVFLPPELIKIPFCKESSDRKAVNQRIRHAENIKKYGVLEPFSVCQEIEEDGFPSFYLLREAERFRAARLSGIEQIPCRIHAKNSESGAEFAIFRQLAAGNLHFLEEAYLFQRLIHEFSRKQAEIAELLGISQSTIANKLRLLRLNAQEQEILRSAGLGERHARALLHIENADLRLCLLKETAKNGYSVLKTEELALRYAASAPVAAKKPPLSPETDLKEPVAHSEVPCGPEAKNAPPEPKPLPEGRIGIERNAPRAASPRAFSCRIPQPHGICPRKFALRDLQPLYNSIERTLSIFKKTGLEVEYRREESDYGALITIKIPQKRAD